MHEWITNTWAIALLAMYMTLLSAYAASTHPEQGKRKVLLRLFSAGIILASALFIWNALV